MFRQIAYISTATTVLLVEISLAVVQIWAVQLEIVAVQTRAVEIPWAVVQIWAGEFQIAVVHNQAVGVPLAVVETNTRGHTRPLPPGPFHILAHSPVHARRSCNRSLCHIRDI